MDWGTIIFMGQSAIFKMAGRSMINLYAGRGGGGGDCPPIMKSSKV